MPAVEIRYWEKWQGREAQAMGNIVNAFNDSQDRYRVVMTEAGAWSSTPDLPMFLAAHEQGDPPDLIGLEDHQIVNLADKGVLSPLDSILDSHELKDAGFHRSFLELASYAGALYGVPVAADVATLYMNCSALRGTRFESGGAPTLISEFDSDLELLGTTGRTGFVPTYPGWWPQAWVRFFGGSWLDEDGRFQPNHPGNVRAFEWIASMRDQPHMDRYLDPVNPIGTREPDPFLSGEVAMVFEGDFLVARLASTPGFEWACAAFPTVSGKPAAMVLADVVAVPTGAKHIDGAAAFLRFASTRRSIEIVALGQGKISPLVDWSQAFLADHPNPKLADLQRILGSATLFHDPRVPGWLGYLDGIKKAFSDVWTHGQEPDAALAAIG